MPTPHSSITVIISILNCTNVPPRTKPLDRTIFLPPNKNSHSSLKFTTPLPNKLETSNSSLVRPPLSNSSHHPDTKTHSSQKANEHPQDSQILLLLVNSTYYYCPHKLFSKSLQSLPCHPNCSPDTHTNPFLFYKYKTQTYHQ